MPSSKGMPTISLSYFTFMATSEIPGHGAYTGFPQTPRYLPVQKAATDWKIFQHWLKLCLFEWYNAVLSSYTPDL